MEQWVPLDKISLYIVGTKDMALKTYFVRNI